MAIPAAPNPLDEAVRELAGTNYEPLSHLASGSFGDVFVVRHRDLGTELVLKLLKPEFKTHEDVVERLKVEAHILTRITHPNLIHVIDFGWARSGQPFLVTEKLTGETLADRLKRERSIPVSEAVDLAVQMLEALAVVHDAKLVHRDIKPANLFLARRPDGGCTLKLLDFGIAKILDPDEGAALGRRIKTAEGMVLGTPAYLAPEQILGRPVDARTDLYAAAGVLYRMLAGRPMFMTKTQDELILAQLQIVPEPISKHTGVSIPAAIEAAVATGVSKAPYHRFQTANEFVAALKAAPAATSISRATVPLHAYVPKAAEPAASTAMPSGFVFRGETFEDGTVYATRSGSTPEPAAVAIRSTAPFTPEAEKTEIAPPGFAPTRPMAVAAARTYPGFLVPALVIAVGVLLVTVIVLAAMVLR